MYNHGMAQGLVLDRVRPGWKKETRERGMTQFALLAREFPLAEHAGKELLAEAKNRFAYDDLLARQKKLVRERLDLIRRYVDTPGRHYRIYHGRIRAGFKWKPAGPVYHVPASLEKELVEKRKKTENAAERITSRRLVWAGGIRRFEKEGLLFESGATPVIFGSEYLEWIDPHPGPDKSDMKIDAKSEVAGLYVGAKLKTSGFSLEAPRARVEWSKDLVKIYPVGEPK